MQTTLSSQVIHTLLGSVVDLVKPRLVLMHLPLFTLEAEELSYSDDPFHTMKDFFLIHGPHYPFIHLLDGISKINVPISFMLILGTLQSSPLKDCLSSSKFKDRLSLFVLLSL